MTREAPNILILDEPTNHLDIDAREALVQAINDYNGAVVLISHDPHLIELTADRLWLVAGRHGAEPFDGDLDDYKDMILSPGRSANERERRGQDGAEAGQEVARQVPSPAI